MASVRDLKKDIDYLVSLVVVDSFQYINAFENADKEAAFKIVNEIMTKRKDLISRVNHPDGKDNPKLIKSHYQSIGKDLLVACDEAYAKLAKLIDKED
ncbi:hypothetical protein [uncultured Sunxiuqinia sp.]|uniref:hypothetical protein n=1 Tax=uncultured Sunxiuqinia sp. TaxID=1573825 RepID=UPI002AA62305|nr:hypothetical protein [uncultured Sunxiuqinia sp.]